MFNILIGLGTGFGLGSMMSFLVSAFLRKQKINHTKQDAQRIIQNAKDKEEQNQEQILNKIEEYKLSLLQQQEEDLETLSQEQHHLQMEIEQLSQQKEEELYKLEKYKKTTNSELDNLLKMNIQKEDNLKKITNILEQKKTETVQILKEQFTINIEKLKSENQEEWQNHIKNQMLIDIKEKEEHFRHNINQQAHFILELILSRFQHPYCPERGIKNVNFKNKTTMEDLLGPDFSKMKILEKECGVDMKINDDEASISILGIDPVRRELGRASLQKMAKRKQIKENEIKSLVQKTKRELFQQIKSDGQRICRELQLADIKTKIKNMMGSLRYRYSFAQNQYFHCQEVGWLCGLLNTELGEDSATARRAGMLHDIGKAMDHSKEGGHAVIGADFIEKHGEKPSIVHAVKAHHHDVTPENTLDFLVISADALSGARPGARRSTVDSYNQKVLTLEKIGRSFKGVKDTYIMSAGREIRVIVDSQKVDDMKALKLSKKIASKIEEECSYPGLIKVTVVRQVTQSVDVQSHQKQAHI